MDRVLSRRSAREIAVRLIFAGVFNAEILFLASQDKMVKIWGLEKEFITKVVTTAIEHCDEIDNKIAGCLTGWTIDRINKIDLACCRAAAAEAMVYDTPKSVIIDEIVIISKNYGTVKSRAFVNGVLAKILA